MSNFGDTIDITPSIETFGGEKLLLYEGYNSC